jgi:hypothetical protein
MAPSIKERLWHKMRLDLARYIPEVAGNRLLMCCACGRFLRAEGDGILKIGRKLGVGTSVVQRVFKQVPWQS